MKSGKEQKAYKGTTHEKFVCQGIDELSKSCIKGAPTGDETVEKITQGCRRKDDKRSEL